MKNSAHLLISTTPLKSGIDHVALCGKRVIKAEWIWENEDHVAHKEEVIKTIKNCCAKCAKTPTMILLDRDYLYAAIDGALVRKPIQRRGSINEARSLFFGRERFNSTSPLGERRER